MSNQKINNFKYSCHYCNINLNNFWSNNDFKVRYLDCLNCPILIRYKFKNDKLCYISLGLIKLAFAFLKCDLLLDIENNKSIIDEVIVINFLIDATPSNYQEKISIYRAFQ